MAAAPPPTTTSGPPPRTAPAGAPTPAPSPAGPFKLLTFADALAAYRADAEAAHNARVTHQPKGPTTGLRSLDRVLGDVLQPGLHVVHGGSGVGKTAYALQVAATCGFPSLFVSCEMAQEELLRRHTARVSGIFLDRLKSGELLPDDAVRYAEQAIAAAPWLSLLDATTAYLPIPELERFAIGAQQGAPHLLVVLDSVHAWAQESGLPVSEYDQLNLHLAELRKLSARLACPVMVIAERNRASMAAGGLSSTAGTRRFEYGASTVVGLSVDTSPSAPPLPALQTPILIAVEKNRSGASGMSLKAVFHGPLQKFTD